VHAFRAWGDLSVVRGTPRGDPGTSIGALHGTREPCPRAEDLAGGVPGHRSGACTTANKSYTAALKQRDSLNTSFKNAIQKINDAITINSTDAVTWQGKVDKYTTTLNAYLAAHPTVATTGSANDKKSLDTMKSAIASLTAEVARLNARVTSLKAQLSSTQDSQGALIQSAADNVASLKTQLSAICKSGL